MIKSNAPYIFSDANCSVVILAKLELKLVGTVNSYFWKTRWQNSRHWYATTLIFAFRRSYISTDSSCRSIEVNWSLIFTRHSSSPNVTNRLKSERFPLSVWDLQSLAGWANFSTNSATRWRFNERRGFKFWTVTKILQRLYPLFTLLSLKYVSWWIG